MADPATTDDDDQLMRAYAQGDARAFERLYERHHAALYRYLRRVLGREAGTQADEVFQDTWLRVVHARERWQPQGATFRTWLFTIAHHRAVDRLRQSGRELSATPSDDASSEAAPWEPADAAPWSLWPAAAVHTEGHSDTSDGAMAERSFWRAAGQRLIDCLEALPPAQRSVFLLHHEDGLSLDDLAQALEIGFETAKSRLRYAMSKLRTCMGAYLPAANTEGSR
jgi:RNA polymerase sigma factor (sigma-70 family)